MEHRCIDSFSSFAVAVAITVEHTQYCVLLLPGSELDFDTGKTVLAVPVIVVSLCY